MAGPWVDDRQARGRRAPSPTPYYSRRSPPPSRRGSYDDRPYMRSSDWSADDQRLPVRERYMASTYRPQYDRRDSDHAMRENSPTDRPPPDRFLPRQVANKVWMSNDYKKKQRATQSQNNGAPGPGEQQTTPQTTMFPSKSAEETSASSPSEDATILATARESRDAAVMDLDSGLHKSNSGPSANEANPNVERGQGAENTCPPVSFSAPSGVGKQVGCNKAGHDDAHPTSWLRPKQKGTNSPGTPTAPTSPIQPTAQNADFSEVLQEFFSTSMNSRESQQELKKAQKLFEATMRDLLYIHGSEEVATREAKASPEVASLLQKQQQLEGKAGTWAEKSKSVALQFAELIGKSAQKDDTVPESIRGEFSRLHNDNERLRAENHKLESRILSLEASLKEWANSLGQPSDIKAELKSAESHLSTLLDSRDALAERTSKCEVGLETLKSNTFDNNNGQIQMLEVANKAHDDSIKVIQEELGRLVGLHSDLKTALEKQQTGLTNSREEILGKCKSFADTNMTEFTKLRGQISTMEENQHSLNEKLAILTQRTDINRSLSVNIDALGKKIQEGEKQYSAQLNQLKNQLNNQLNGLKAAVSEHHSHLSRVAQPATANMAPPAATSAACFPQAPIPSVPTSNILSSQVPYSYPSWNTAVAVQHSPAQGISRGPTAQPMPQTGDRSPAGAPQWLYGAVSSPTSEQTPTARELLLRIVALEQFVSGHEHRLNFTTMESCWNPMLQYIMGYIGKNYRYPETVAQDLSSLQSMAQAHTQNLDELSRRLTDISSKQQDLSDADLQKQLQEQNAMIESLKQWTQSDFKDLVTGVISTEIEQVQQLCNDLRRHVERSLDELQQSTNSTKQMLADLQTRDTPNDSNTEVISKFAALETEFTDLESSCAQEITTLHGKVADLAQVIKGLHTGSGGSSGGRDGRAVQQPTERKRVAGQARAPSILGEVNEVDGDASDAVLDSKRKRRRKMAD